MSTCTRCPSMERPIVALVPPQYRRAQPFAVFLECLQRAADEADAAAGRSDAAVSGPASAGGGTPTNGWVARTGA